MLLRGTNKGEGYGRVRLVWRPDKAEDPVDRQVLWDEYKHRHNLVWRFVFQVTLAAVFLSIVPYIAPQLAITALGRWLFVAPELAFLLVLFSLFVTSNELRGSRI